MSNDQRSRQGRMARWMMSAAVAGVAMGLWATTTQSLGQQRVGSDGRELDASNRFGSGGLNSGSAVPTRFLGNQIITGNVTGGQQFRGFVPYTDPTAFRGTTAGQNMDDFTRSSAGVPRGQFSNNNAGNFTTFYGDARGVAPPQGYRQQVPGSVGAVPSPAVARGAYDMRLGQVSAEQHMLSVKTNQLMLPGPVDPNSGPTVLTASPLYGVRQWSFANPDDQASLDVLGGGATSVQGRASRIDNATLDRMRGELNNTLDSNRPIDASTPPLEDGTSGENAAPAGDLNRPLDKPFESVDPSMQNRPLDSGAAGTGALSSAGADTNQSLRAKVMRQPGTTPRTLASASPAYRDLESRLARYQKGKSVTADTDANREYNRERRELEAAQAKAGTGAAGLPGSGVTPGIAQPGQGTGTGAVALPGAAAPGGTTPGVAAPKVEPLPGVTEALPKPSGDPNKPAPKMIDSLVRDLKPSATTELMKEAEQLMRDGRYTTALERYDQVEQVIPDDPLATLGRATAELGASYYTRADADLRKALTNHPALLMGRYDLRAFLGEDRLQYLIKDLKDIANKDQAQARPVFLLSYIYYNLGDERRAAGYLDLAQKRSGGNDPVIKLIKEHWTLPEAGPDQPMNK